MGSSSSGIELITNIKEWELRILMDDSVKVFAPKTK